MIYHSGIFYPDNEEKLRALATVTEKGDSHKAFILPHMHLDYIANLYRKAFASIDDGKRIVAILPIHREVLVKDEGKIIFSPASREEETLLGKVKVKSLCEDDAAPYEEEEYSQELLYPFVAANTPSSEICPIFTKIRNSENVKKLTAFLRTLDDGNTVFILSSNMTGKLPEVNVTEERDKAIGLLERGENALDMWQKGHIGICAFPQIVALSRLGSGKWHLMGVSEKETRAGHAALYMD